MSHTAVPGDTFFCHEVPGHSRCKKKIEKGSCLSLDGSIDSTSCRGHSHNPAANLQQALKWIHKDKQSKTQTVGFVAQKYPSVTWPKIPR
jgi:hypothetical protein